MTIPATPEQVGLENLLKQCREATDPLEIVNAFMKNPVGIGLPGDYWQKRICILAEELAQRNSNKKNRRKIDEQTEIRRRQFV